MLKALLLQRWYSLSDEGLEEALSDRLSFRRFCGFALDDETPDAKTLCRFRLALEAADVPERLFCRVGPAIGGERFVLKGSTLICASLIEADVKRPPKDEGEVAERDPDAGFTRRGQKSFFGDKAHIAVDQGTDLICIRGAILTGADVGDSLAADALIQGDEAAVYADKAYDSRVRRPGPRRGRHRRCGDVSPAPAPPPARLAEVDERGAHPDPLSGRAAVRSDETILWLSPGSLPRPRPQPRPAAVDVHGDQPEPRRPAHRRLNPHPQTAPPCNRRSAAHQPAET
jgi:IS5 family transposase